MKKARWGILALGLTLLLSASSFADVEFKGLDTSEIPLLISYIDILVAHLNSSGAPRTRDHITFLNEKKDPVGAIVADFDPKNPLYQLFTQKTIVIQKDDLKNWEKAIQETQKRDLREDIPPEQLHGIVENADSVALDWARPRGLGGRPAPAPTLRRQRNASERFARNTPEKADKVSEIGQAIVKEL